MDEEAEDVSKTRKKSRPVDIKKVNLIPNVLKEEMAIDSSDRND